MGERRWQWLTPRCNSGCLDFALANRSLTMSRLKIYYQYLNKRLDALPKDLLWTQLNGIAIAGFASIELAFISIPERIKQI